MKKIKTARRPRLAFQTETVRTLDRALLENAIGGLAGCGTTSVSDTNRSRFADCGGD